MEPIDKGKDVFFERQTKQSLEVLQQSLVEFSDRSDALVKLIKKELKSEGVSSSKPRLVVDFDFANDDLKQLEPCVYVNIWSRKANLFVMISFSFSGIISIRTKGVVQEGWKKLNKIVCGNEGLGVSSYVDSKLHKEFFFEEKMFNAFTSNEAYNVNYERFAISDDRERFTHSFNYLKNLFLERREVLAS